MPILEVQTQDYLHQTLGGQLHTTAWNGAARLPAFLTARYRFAHLDLMGRELLLVIDEAPEQESPATIRKHTEQVRAKWSGPVVYVRDQVTAYNRKRLIEQRVPFIIPGNQMYLPDLGLDLREYFRTPSPSKRKFWPATQAVLIYVLLNRKDNETTAAALAPKLGYSTMTLSRVFNELESVELAESASIGRQRVLHFPTNGQETWRRAQQWLINPVKSRHFVVGHPQGLRAGQQALADYTMLAESHRPVIAISHKQWQSFRNTELAIELQGLEEANYEVEVWKYEPRQYIRPRLVDPLSLYLTIEQSGDERVEQALEDLMEQIQW